MEVAKAPLCR